MQNESSIIPINTSGLVIKRKQCEHAQHYDDRATAAVALANYYRLHPMRYGRHYLIAACYYQLALSDYHAAAKEKPEQNTIFTGEIKEINKSLYDTLLYLWCYLNQPRDPILFQNLEKTISLWKNDKENLKKLRKNLAKLLEPFQLSTIKTFKDFIYYPELEKTIKSINYCIKEYIKFLIDDTLKCFIKLTGKQPPCAYTFIGFGSMADGLLTPYSDVEFGILIENENRRAYFTVITQLLHWRMINLGETTSKIMLNGNANELRPQSSLRSTVINGLSFDGAGPPGDKSPLGLSWPDSQEPILLTTPQRLAQLPAAWASWSNNIVLKKNYPTLPLDVLHACFITGDEALWQTYQQQIKTIAPDFLKEQAKYWIFRDRARFEPSGGRVVNQHHIFSPKHDLLRLPVLLMRHLALHDGLFDIPVLSVPSRSLNLSNILHNVTPLLVTASALRSAMYLQASEQIEEINFMTLDLQRQMTSELIYFYVMIAEWLAAPDAPLDFTRHSISESCLIGDVESLFGDREQAKQSYRQAIEVGQTLWQQAKSADEKAQLDVWLSRATQQWLALEQHYPTLQYLYNLGEKRLAHYQKNLPGSLALARWYQQQAETAQALGDFSVTHDYIIKAKGIYEHRYGDNTVIPVVQQCYDLELQLQNQTYIDRHFTHRLIHRLHQLHLREHTHPDTAQALRYYIEPAYTLSLEGQRQPELLKNLQNFCADETANAHSRLVLLGNSGSGKTVSLQSLVHRLWGDYDTTGHHPVRIPLLILLRDLPPDRKPDLDCIVAYTLLSLGFLSNEVQILKSNYRWVILLDGYDEMPFYLRRVSLESLLHWMKHANYKTVVSCRTQRFQNQEEHQEFLGIGTEQVKTWYITPFDNAQIEDYLVRYLANPERQEVGWDLEKYKSFFMQYSTLQTLATNPLLLYLIISVLPELSQQPQTLQSITRYSIYESFIKRWFLREGRRYRKYVKVDDDIDCLQRGFSCFSNCLAIKMLEYKTQQAIYDPQSEIDDPMHKVWHQFFDPRNTELAQQRAGCPLRRSGDYQYQFIHPSFRDYFAAQHFLTKLKEITDKQKFNAILQSAFSRELLNTEPQILYFLADCINEETKDNWLKIVKYSRKENSKTGMKPMDAISVAQWKATQNAVKNMAANAMTVLNYAGITFSGMDLSDVRIKGADLSQGIFHQTNFKNANLSQIQWHQAYLRAAIWQNAKLANIQFGELMYLELQDNEPMHWLVSDARKQQIAIGCKSEIRLFNISNNKLIEGKILQCETYNLAWNPCSEVNILAASAINNTILLWNTKTGEYNLLSGHPDAKLYDSNSKEPVDADFLEHSPCLVWSPNGKILASGSSDGAIHIWDFTKRKLNEQPDKWSLNYPERVTVTCLAWSADSQHFAAGGADGAIHLWNIKTKQYLKKLQPPQTIPVCCLEWSPDGKVLASAAGTKQKKIQHVIRLWKNPIDSQNSILELSGHSFVISSLLWFPNSEILISGSWDHTIRFWNVQTGSLLKSFPGHTDGIIKLAWCDSGKLLVSIGWDWKIRLWKPELEFAHPLKISEQNRFRVIGLAQRPSDRSLVMGSTDGKIRIFKDLNSNPHILEENTVWIACLAWRSDSKVLASGGSHGEKEGPIFIWDFSQGKISIRAELKEHTGWVHCLAWNPIHQDILASGGQDQKVRLWNIANPASPSTALLNPGNIDDDERIRCLAWSSDGQLLAAKISGKSVSKKIWLWDLSRGLDSIREYGVDSIPRYYFSAESNTNRFARITWNYNDTKLISGNGDNTITMWNRQGKEISILSKQHQAFIVYLKCFLVQKHEYLISADEYGLLILWNLDAGIICSKQSLHPLEDLILCEDSNVLITRDKNAGITYWMGSETLSDALLSRCLPNWQIKKRLRLDLQLADINIIDAYSLSDENRRLLQQGGV